MSSSIGSVFDTLADIKLQLDNLTARVAKLEKSAPALSDKNNSQLAIPSSSAIALLREENKQAIEDLRADIMEDIIPRVDVIGRQIAYQMSADNANEQWRQAIINKDNQGQKLLTGSKAPSNWMNNQGTVRKFLDDDDY